MSGVDYTNIKENKDADMQWDESDPDKLQNICSGAVNVEDINNIATIFAKRFSVPRAAIKFKFKRIDNMDDPDYQTHTKIIYYVENYTCGGRTYPEKILMEEKVKMPDRLINELNRLHPRPAPQLLITNVELNKGKQVKVESIPSQYHAPTPCLCPQCGMNPQNGCQCKNNRQFKAVPQPRPSPQTSSR